VRSDEHRDRLTVGDDRHGCEHVWGEGRRSVRRVMLYHDLIAIAGLQRTLHDTGKA